ncbi:hypothetical protein OIU85_014844 [Salix viminalis]|uniref:Uncharacterized protein n=1 Tax=Salix viminalis TaxID=40686 RepID=A0A9Q0NJJ4_SALVM|nr:hypothetical protein OIU85_014844 [Salix viminalis]
MVQREATGIFLRFPTRTTQSRYVSAIITSTGSSSRSRSCSKGASIFVATASKNPGKSFARPSSEGMQLGIVAKQMLAGFVVSEPMKPSHSSVTTKVKRMSGFLTDMSLQRFIMGFTCPLPGYGIATT